MKTMRCLLCLMLCAAVAVPAGALSEGGAGVCYRVTGGKNGLFLLGTIHVGNESMYPVGEHIRAALRASDTLVLECDTESGAATKQMAAMMYYPVGDTLEDHVSPQTYELLAQACEMRGHPIGMLNAMRPWAVTSMLAVDATAASMGVTDMGRALELGVENQIGALAGDMPRAYLETAADQLAVLDGFSPELQEYMLSSTLRSILHPGESAAAGEADVGKWPDWWAAGDADSFAESYLASLADDPEQALITEYHEGLVSKRNAIMAEGLRALMESDERHEYFAMVGLLHIALPGDSVVSLLRDMGYTVERVPMQARGQ